jgi:hypothetical protein
MLNRLAGSLVSVVAAMTVLMPVLGAFFVAVEVIHMVDIVVGVCMLAVFGIMAVVAMVRIEVIIHMAVKVAGAMKPWASPDEDSTTEPLRTIVSIGGALVGGIVIIAVGTGRGYSNAEADLGLGPGRSYRKTKCGNKSDCKDVDASHEFTSGLLEVNSGGGVC